MKLKITLIFLLSLFTLFYFKDYFLISAEVTPQATRPQTATQVFEVLKHNIANMSDYGGTALTQEKIEQLVQIADTVRVFHFWASWCDPCLNELPDFFKFAKQKNVDSLKNGRAAGVQFFVVSMDFEQEGLRKFIKIFPEFEQAHLIQIWDRKSNLSKAYGIDKLPSTLIVYPNGKVISHDGAIDWKNYSFIN